MFMEAIFTIINNGSNHGIFQKGKWTNQLQYNCTIK